MDTTLQHIAIVPDGNRRWAVAQGLPKLVGHTKGAKKVKEIGLAAIEAGIPYLTIWGMSTENLNRSKKEVDHLFSLFGRLVDYLGDFFENDVRLKVVGNMDLLPSAVVEKLYNVVEKTKDHSTLTLTLSVAYGGKDDIVRAVRRCISDSNKPQEVDETLFATYMDMVDTPEIDLVVRTGGNKRLSNSWLWHAAYAELYFTDTFWPAFTPEEFRRSIDWFYKQKRNKGR